MSDARLMKVWRDLWTGRGRMLIMVGAVAVSLFGVGATLGAFSIMTREMNRAYLSTRPASATLDTHNLDEKLLDAVRRVPGVQRAEARATLLGRVRVGRDWRPMVLFVVADFRNMQLATVEPVLGEWPPSRMSLLVERLALPLLGVDVGGIVDVKPPHAPATTLRVSGVAYDGGLAPATNVGGTG